MSFAPLYDSGYYPNDFYSLNNQFYLKINTNLKYVIGKEDHIQASIVSISDIPEGLEAEEIDFTANFPLLKLAKSVKVSCQLNHPYATHLWCDDELFQADLAAALKHIKHQRVKIATISNEEQFDSNGLLEPSTVELIVSPVKKPKFFVSFVFLSHFSATILKSKEASYLIIHGSHYFYKDIANRIVVYDLNNPAVPLEVNKPMPLTKPYFLQGFFLGVDDTLYTYRASKCSLVPLLKSQTTSAELAPFYISFKTPDTQEYFYSVANSTLLDKNRELLKRFDYPLTFLVINNALHAIVHTKKVFTERNKNAKHNTLPYLIKLQEPLSATTCISRQQDHLASSYAFRISASSFSIYGKAVADNVSYHAPLVVIRFELDDDYSLFSTLIPKYHFVYRISNRFISKNGVYNKLLARKLVIKAFKSLYNTESKFAVCPASLDGNFSDYPQFYSFNTSAPLSVNFNSLVLANHQGFLREAHLSAPRKVFVKELASHLALDEYPELAHMDYSTKYNTVAYFKHSKSG